MGTWMVQAFWKTVSCKVKHKFALIPTNLILQYLLETMKTSIYTKTSIQRFTDTTWK